MTGLSPQPSGGWKNFYLQSSSFKGFMLYIVGHLYYIISILVRLPKSALEIGAGTGFHSCFTSYFGINAWLWT